MEESAMCRNVLFVAVVLAVVLAAGCASGESFVKPGYDFGAVKKVAVVEVVGDFGGEAAKNEIADYFAMELLKKGYEPVERTQVQAVLSEQKFEASNLTTPEGAAQAGRILNVSAVVIMNVGEFGERISMTAKMVDVQDASILWMGEGTGTTGRTLATIGGAAAGVGMGIAVGHGRTGNIVGGLAGGALGGAAGYTLSPQQATQARNVIQKMCGSLPSKL
jgi:TolB-like protein